MLADLVAAFLPTFAILVAVGGVLAAPMIWERWND